MVHTLMSHSTHIYETWHTHICETPAAPHSRSHVNESYPSGESWHTNIWLMARMYSCNDCSAPRTLAYGRVTSLRTCVHACNAYSAPCTIPYGWVTSKRHMQMSHGTHMHESQHTYSWVMAHTFVWHNCPPRPAHTHQPSFAHRRLLLHMTYIACTYMSCIYVYTNTCIHHANTCTHSRVEDS